MMWAVFAFLSAVFAAFSSILAKVGIEGVNSNLAYGVTDSRCAGNGVGHSFSDRRTARNRQHRKEKLAVFDSFGACDGRVVALLLQGVAARRCVKSRSRR